MAPVESPSDSRVPQVLVGTLVPTFIGTAFTFGRLYTRAFMLKNWGHDDTCIAIAWIGTVILAALNGVLTEYGVGHHAQFIPKSHVIMSLKIGYFTQVAYQFTLWITKIGICLFYIRIFQERKSRHTVYLMMGFLCVTFVPLEFVTAFRCHPVDEAWKLGSTQCLASNPIVLTLAVSNILADLMLMAFVIPQILALQMNKKQKNSLIAVVSLGLLVVIAAAVRVSRAILLETNKDVTWNGYDKAIWSSIEVNTGLFCASAPCIRPLLRKITPGFLSTSERTDYKSGQTPGGTYGRKSSRLSQLAGTGQRSQNQPFELSSRADDVEKLPNGTGSNTRVFWDGGKRKKGTEDHDDDMGSEHGILSDGLKGGNIIKTVSVSVSQEMPHRGDQNSPSRDSSIVGVEHV